MRIYIIKSAVKPNFLSLILKGIYVLEKSSLDLLAIVLIRKSKINLTDWAGFGYIPAISPHHPLVLNVCSLTAWRQCPPDRKYRDRQSA
jgi:hypothetical protein